MDKQKKIIIAVVAVIIVAIVAIILYFAFKKESFDGKGITVDVSMDGLVRDVKKDLNSLGIKLKK